MNLHASSKWIKYVFQLIQSCSVKFKFINLLLWESAIPWRCTCISAPGAHVFGESLTRSTSGAIRHGRRRMDHCYYKFWREQRQTRKNRSSHSLERASGEPLVIVARVPYVNFKSLFGPVISFNQCRKSAQMLTPFMERSVNIILLCFWFCVCLLFYGLSTTTVM